MLIQCQGWRCWHTTSISHDHLQSCQLLAVMSGGSTPARTLPCRRAVLPTRGRPRWLHSNEQNEHRVCVGVRLVAGRGLGACTHCCCSPALVAYGKDGSCAVISQQDALAADIDHLRQSTSCQAVNNSSLCCCTRAPMHAHTTASGVAAGRTQTPLAFKRCCNLWPACPDAEQTVIECSGTF